MGALARSEVSGSRQREMSECESGRTRERGRGEGQIEPASESMSTYFERFQRSQIFARL